jgi:hypothetical protein
VKAERGSTLPLIIGLASLLLATTFTFSELQSLLLLRSRALTDARFAALYIARETAGIPPVIGLDYSPAVLGELAGVSSVTVTSNDGKTFASKVCLVWKSPLGLRPEALVCDEAKARVIF